MKQLLRTCSLPDLAEENLDDSIEVPKIKKTPEMWADIFDKKQENFTSETNKKINPENSDKTLQNNAEDIVEKLPDKIKISDDVKSSEDLRLSEDIEVNSIASDDTNFSDDLISDDDLLQNEMKKLLLSDTGITFRQFF